MSFSLRTALPAPQLRLLLVPLLGLAVPSAPGAGVAASGALLLTAALTQPAPAWRTNMTGQCWTNSSCDRALIVSHGGDWSLTFPYDSLPAFQLAWQDGADCVKGDFRVSVDNVGMVTHSSPIEVYESPRCAGKRIENLTAAEISRCPMALTNYTFQRWDTMLAWAEQRVIFMLCVKRSQDLPRAISTILEAGAQDRAFLEISLGDLVSLVPRIPGWDRVYYLVQAGSMEEVLRLAVNVSAALRARAFTCEFNPGYQKWPGLNISAAVSQLHEAGVRSLAATSKFEPSVLEQEGLFRNGFDVVYTYDTKNAVKARTVVDKARGVAPP